MLTIYAPFNNKNSKAYEVFNGVQKSWPDQTKMLDNQTEIEPVANSMFWGFVGNNRSMVQKLEARKHQFWFTDTPYFGSFDNNNFSQFSISQHHSKVLTDQFEPGSTFKIVAATASLAENKVTLDQEFSCENGKFDYFGSIIKDHEPYEQLTISQIIKHSSNIGIIKIAEEVGSNSIYKFAKLFGFGTPTNFDMAGETAGKLKPEKEWSRISIGQISMGHEVAVNTLQLAVAFSAIANNAFIVKPYIIDRIYNKDKNSEQKTIPVVKRKISSEKKINKIKDMLRQVVLDGTGTEADIQGWEVAG